MNSKFKIHVFTAGHGSSQTKPFDEAVKDLTVDSNKILQNADFDYKTFQQMLDKHWNDDDIINW